MFSRFLFLVWVLSIHSFGSPEEPTLLQGAGIKHRADSDGKQDKRFKDDQGNSRIARSLWPISFGAEEAHPAIESFLTDIPSAMKTRVSASLQHLLWACRGNEVSEVLSELDDISYNQIPSFIDNIKILFPVPIRVFIERKISEGEIEPTSSLCMQDILKSLKKISPPKRREFSQTLVDFFTKEMGIFYRADCVDFFAPLPSEERASIIESLHNLFGQTMENGRDYVEPILKTLRKIPAEDRPFVTQALSNFFQETPLDASIASHCIKEVYTQMIQVKRDAENSTLGFPKVSIKDNTKATMLSESLKNYVERNINAWSNLPVPPISEWTDDADSDENSNSDTFSESERASSGEEDSF